MASPLVSEAPCLDPKVCRHWRGSPHDTPNLSKIESSKSPAVSSTWLDDQDHRPGLQLMSRIMRMANRHPGHLSSLMVGPAVPNPSCERERVEAELDQLCRMP